MLLDSWAIPCCMILSYFFLSRRYRWLQYAGVLLCLAGAGLLFKSDLEADHDYPAQDALRGDLYCILGATLYGVSNVLEEKLAHTYEITEIIGMLGLSGAIVSGIQLSILERKELSSMTWSGPVVGYLLMFDICLFCLYSCAPLLFRLSSATFFNMSLLTSDFYSLIVGLIIFNAKINFWYAGAFIATVAGIFVYNLRNAEELSAVKKASESENGPLEPSNSKASDAIESESSNANLINTSHAHDMSRTPPSTEYISLAIQDEPETIQQK
ncbi:hypothetical protein BDF19DRAFT_442122 [Syncephalis fuscata]|nr:hypothetical protein BDF19DRAFT_442122 [Syncephalis fuscata]